MFAIIVKFEVKPEHAEAWPDLTREFTEACRAEPGCLWFDWSRSVDDPNEYVLLEAYRDMQAVQEHDAPHVDKAMDELGQYLTRRPRFVRFASDTNEWNPLAAMRMPGEDATA